ncbi:hypothetical protein [Streptomyces sp. NPDC001415]
MARVRLGVAEWREEMPRAAVEQIEARGVAAARIPDVAASPGVSNSLVLYPFSMESTDSTAEWLVARWKTAPTEVIAEGATACEFGCAGPAWRLAALLDGPAVPMSPYPGSLSRAATPAGAEDVAARELAVYRAELTAAR